MVEAENKAAADAAPVQQVGDELHLTDDRGVIKKIIKVGEEGPDIKQG